MDDLNDPRISAYRPQRRLLLPAPPGKRQKPSQAQRRQKAATKARADARAKRLHLVGLTNVAVIVMGVIAVGLVIMVFVVAMAGMH
jgi:hypothetical protein